MEWNHLRLEFNIAYLNHEENSAFFTLSGRVSVRHETPNGAVEEEAMALAIAEESNAADGRLADLRKLADNGWSSDTILQIRFTPKR